MNNDRTAFITQRTKMAKIFGMTGDLNKKEVTRYNKFWAELSTLVAEALKDPDAPEWVTNLNKLIEPLTLDASKCHPEPLGKVAEVVEDFCENWEEGSYPKHKSYFFFGKALLGLFSDNTSGIFGFGDGLFFADYAKYYDFLYGEA